MTRPCRARGNFVATHVPRAQSSGALSIIVAKLFTCTVFLRIGPTAPVRLPRDNVTESALALLIRVAVFVVA